MSTHNIGFYEEISKSSLNYHQISSNTHHISISEEHSSSPSSNIMITRLCNLLQFLTPVKMINFR